MYQELRENFILRLHDLDPAVLQHVLSVLDAVVVDYTIAKAEKGLSVPGREELEQIIKLYIICKGIEGCQKTTLSGYSLALMNFKNHMISPLEEITVNDIRKYLLTYKLENKISDRSLDHLRTVLMGFFVWCQNEGHISKNPMASIRPIKFRKEKKPPLDPDELERLRGCCRDDRERALVEVLYSTGCRISEIINARIDDINFNVNPVSIKIIGKGNKPGTVFMSPRAVAALRKYLAGRKHNSDHIFNNDRGGTPLKKENAERIFRELRKLAGLEDKRLTPHTLRHTLGTNLALMAPIQVVQRTLRHECIDTTMIYAETSEKDVIHYHSRILM